MNNTKVIAFYLPQFHPIKENDKWWGKGFTEWYNVSRAKPLFPSHYQPKIPKDLGFYDLRLSETRELQAKFAKESGIDAFCYWHYWFGNKKRLLERPFDEVLKSKSPNFPFCLAWANHSWFKKTWDPKSGDELLIEQKYLGVKDYTDYFISLIDAFKDPRYLRIENKPVFTIFDPLAIPDAKLFINLWNKLALQEGIDGIYFIGFTYHPNKVDEIIELGFDSVTVDTLRESFINRPFHLKISQKIKKHFLNRPRLLNYRNYVNYSIKYFDKASEEIPCILPNYDHSPRSETEEWY